MIETWEQYEEIGTRLGDRPGRGREFRFADGREFAESDDRDQLRTGLRERGTKRGHLTLPMSRAFDLRPAR